MKANQVFLPVLENASEANKVRTTLGVFERNKFFFNLPGFIIESVEAVSLSFRILSQFRLKPSLRAGMTLQYETTKEGRVSWRLARDNYFLSPM